MAYDKKKILITGVSGLLGSNLAYAFASDYDVIGLYKNFSLKLKGIKSESVDILHASSLVKVMASFKPDVVVHCAALANIDECERNPVLAKQLNVEGTANVLQALEGSDVKLIHISTDAVFDGLKGRYKEGDATNPANQYGITKLEAEQIVSKYKNLLIVRTAFWGWNAQPKLCFAEFVIQELSQGKKIQGFTDIFTTFLYTFVLARLIDTAIRKDLKGVYHFASSTAFSKYAFACQIAERLNLDKTLIEPVSIEAATLVHRGRDLTLCADQLARDLGQKVPSLEESIEQFCRDFQSGFFSKIKMSGDL